MARARNIKPALFKNEVLGVADPLYTILFEGLWVLADRAGRLEDRPLRIKAEVLPYRDGINTDSMLTWLMVNGFIVRYTSHDGKNYIQIVNFEKHQNPHKNESESEIPEYNQETDLIPCKDENTSEKIGITRADSFNLIPDSFNLIPDSLRVPVAAEKSATPPRQKKPIAENETALQAGCRETWAAYAKAYLDRYKTEPIRNATVNACIKSFVKRIGAEEAPFVAEFYVRHQKSYYVSKGHDVKSMLADAEGLRTQWATNRQVTTHQANEADRMQGQTDTYAKLIAEAQQKEQTV